jgi:hypothetical protein
VQCREDWAGEDRVSLLDGWLSRALIIRSIQTEQDSREEDSASCVLPKDEFDRIVGERLIGEVIPGVCVPPEDAGKQNSDE